MRWGTAAVSRSWFVGYAGFIPCVVCGESRFVEDYGEERIWRRLDIWQAKAVIHAQLPGTRCQTHGVLRVADPWVETKSRFTMAAADPAEDG